MLTIRKEQDQALALAMEQQFEQKIFIHLKKFWPANCRSQGEAGVRESIRQGVDRAHGYGMKTEYDIARYIDLMYSMGMDFDSDPEFPWVIEILNNEKSPLSEKMDRLYEETEQRLGVTEINRMKGPSLT